MDLQDENYVIGKELVGLLIPMLEDVNKNNNYRYAEFMTGSYVVDVAKDILKVKNNDKLLRKVPQKNSQYLLKDTVKYLYGHYQ